MAAIPIILRILNGNDFSKLFVNLVTFAPVIAEFARIVKITFPTAGIDQQ